MSTRLRPAPSLRGDIENVLTGRGGVRIAATAKWLATMVDAPITAVERELETLRLAGVLTYHMLRSGKVLWKKVDRNHHKWQSVASLNR